MSRKRTPKTEFEIFKSIRRDWGGFNPVTRIKESEKIYSREKNQKILDENYEEFLEETYLDNTEDYYE